MYLSFGIIPQVALEERTCILHCDCEAESKERTSYKYFHFWVLAPLFLGDIPDKLKLSYHDASDSDFSYHKKWVEHDLMQLFLVLILRGCDSTSPNAACPL